MWPQGWRTASPAAGRELLPGSSSEQGVPSFFCQDRRGLVIGSANCSPQVRTHWNARHHAAREKNFLSAYGI
jgi:hypothetical protein